MKEFTRPGSLDWLLDETTVVANRAGRLTPQQTDVLDDRARRSKRVRVLKSVVYMGVTVLVVVAGSSLGHAVLAAALGLALAVVVLSAFRPWSDPLGDDVREGRVEAVAGTPRKTGLVTPSVLWSRLRTGPSSSPMGPFIKTLTIEGKRLAVPAWTWALIDDRRVIRAYYLPKSMTLLSIESADGLEGPPVRVPEPWSWRDLLPWSRPK